MLLNFINKILGNRKLLNLLIYLGIFLFLLNPTVDPDLGWHLKYGEYIVKYHTFLTKDIFSWTMSGYPWYSISWIFDASLYLIFPIIHFFGLSLIAVIILVFTYYFTFKKFTLPYHLLIVLSIVFIYFLQSIAGVGLRVQLFELLFASMLGYVLRSLDESYTFRKLLIIPLIILVWCNMHGSFLIGIAMVEAFVVSGIFKFIKIYLNENNIHDKIRTELKKISALFVVGIFSPGLIILNPFGEKIFFQVIGYFPGKIVKGIAEWFPVAYPSEQWFFLVAWTLLLIYFVLKKRKTPQGFYQAVITFIFSYLAFKARRMVGPYIVITFPFFLQEISKSSKLLKIKLSSSVKIFIFIIFLSFLASGLFVRLPNINFARIDINTYCNFFRCSLLASKFIKENPLPDRTFTPYNIGGFLIWQNPQTKVFIDGRMDQWNKDGFSPFFDHQLITYNNDEKTFNKYNFSAVYAFPESSLDLKLRKLEKEWQIVFEDNNAVIYRRIEK